MAFDSPFAGSEASDEIVHLDADLTTPAALSCPQQAFLFRLPDDALSYESGCLNGHCGLSAVQPLRFRFRVGGVTAACHGVFRQEPSPYPVKFEFTPAAAGRASAFEHVCGAK
jgi:hypothetical protein